MYTWVKYVQNHVINYIGIFLQVCNAKQFIITALKGMQQRKKSLQDEH